MQASVVAACELSSCGSETLDMWDPSGPGIEPVSPALAGRFLSTVPPGKSYSGILKFLGEFSGEIISLFSLWKPILNVNTIKLTTGKYHRILWKVLTIATLSVSLFYGGRCHYFLFPKLAVQS